MPSDKLKNLIQKTIEVLNSRERANSIFLSLRADNFLKEEIKKETEYLDSHYENPEIGQRIWHLREKLNSISFCNYCETSPIKWHRYTDGYFKTCGNNSCKQKEKASSFKKTIHSKEFSLSGKKKKWIENRKKTMVKKYGVDHNWKGDLRDSFKKTMVEKYGVDHPMKSKEISEKRIQTCIKKFGTSDMFSLEKTKKTNLSRWGTETVMKNEEIKNRVSSGMKRTKNRKTQEKLKSHNINLNLSEGLTYDLSCLECNLNFSISHTGLNIRLRNNINPCPKCNPIVYTHSLAEKEILDLIRKNYAGEIKENYKELFRKNKKFSGVDLYLPEERIAIEYNGLYWHGEFYKDKKYHMEKTKYLMGMGIRLYHIWEDDWVFNRDLCTSFLLNLIGKTQKIPARKCKISGINGSLYRNFCEENHLQGYAPAKIKLGLFYEDELVSIMSFSRPRKLINSNEDVEGSKWELIRLCSKKGTSIVGGASKLFKKFTDENSPHEVVSYCDISRSPDPDSSVYRKILFEKFKATDPGYYWVIEGERQNRLNWTKRKLVALGKDPQKTEVEIMQEMGYYRIWDCGNYKFVWRNL